RFFPELSHCFSKRQDLLRLTAESADRDLGLFGLPFANYEYDGDLLQRVFANLEVDLLVARIDLSTQAGSLQLGQNLFCVSIGLGDDACDDDLDRCQP